MKDLTVRVHDVVRSIPAGRVMTYGDVAIVVGTGARAVGRVLHDGGHDIPWWRVVDAGGRPYQDAAGRARVKFIEESTALLDDGSDVRVDLARALWTETA
ncbi:MGMT family protein [Actinoplanes bogorensis]|uniref:MGMT family protein n=1 Tax=Paractinoplanes bogorensis TaxID=1610840 RepID=A0ABS5YRL0_9ACTN|nr:MGMT family protein [Actinoplanes bogorensis]MBU2666074.1 MGMT family protein [Actinoplanes bogorensis]